MAQILTLRQVSSKPGLKTHYIAEEGLELLTLPTPFKDWDYECRVPTVGFTWCWESNLGSRQVFYQMASPAHTGLFKKTFQPAVIRHLKYLALPQFSKHHHEQGTVLD